MPESLESTGRVQIRYSQSSTDEKYGGDQFEYQQLSDEAINVVRYFMRRGLFTFSLEQEAEYPRFFGPRACGHLRKWIAYKVGNSTPHLFGSLRTDVLETTYNEEPTLAACQRIDAAIAARGVEKNDIILGHDIKGEACSVVYPGEEERLTLTMYYRTINPGGENYKTLWHSPASVFDPLSRGTERIYRSVKGGSDGEEVLQNIARIVWLQSHGCIYHRGSGAVIGITHRALLLEQGMKIQEAQGTRENNPYIADFIAMSFDTIDAFLRFYPRLLAATDYPSLIRKITLPDLAALRESVYREVHEQLMGVSADAAHPFLSLSSVSSDDATGDQAHDQARLPGYASATSQQRSRPKRESAEPVRPTAEATPQARFLGSRRARAPRIAPSQLKIQSSCENYSPDGRRKRRAFTIPLRYVWRKGI